MSDNKPVGALWAGTGKVAFSGTLQLQGREGPTIKIVVFPNSYKGENERAPDYKIYLSKPREAKRDAGEDREEF